MNAAKFQNINTIQVLVCWKTYGPLCSSSTEHFSKRSTTKKHVWVYKFLSQTHTQTHTNTHKHTQHTHTYTHTHTHTHTAHDVHWPRVLQWHCGKFNAPATLHFCAPPAALRQYSLLSSAQEEGVPCPSVHCRFCSSIHARLPIAIDSG